MARKTNIRMKDVARMANVSTATVSYVLNDSPQVSDATRTRVLKVIDELNYQRNPIAKTLRTQRSGTIGVMVEDMTVFNAPQIIDAINEFTDEAGYHIVLSNVRLNTRLLRDYHRLRYDRGTIEAYHETIGEAVNVLLNRQIDGIIYIGEHVHDVTGLIDSAGEPCVYTYCYSQDPNSYSINYDDYEAASLAVNHLIDSGHERIATIAGPPDSFSTRERLKAFRHAVTEHSLTPSEELVEEGDWEYESGYHAVGKLLERDRRITAIFAMNDLMAVGAMDAIRAHGLEVPTDISVVGFDNRDASAYCHPRLTTVELPLREMGTAAARTLIDLIGRHRPEEHNVTLPCRLVERESVRRRAQGNGQQGKGKV